MKQKISHWVPVAFCASLSLINLVAFIAFSKEAWVIPFLCFLPMCFFFVAAVTHHLQREVSELRKQVSELQTKGRNT